MKKKFGITAAAILAAISLSACSNSNQSSSSSNQSKTTSSQVEKKSSSTSASSSSTSSSQASSTSSSTAASSSSSKADEPSSQAPKSRMAQMTAKLRKALPDMLLPTKDGLGAGSDNLNVRYTKSSDTNTVYYSVGSSAANFNSSSVKNEKPFAVLTQTKNGDADSIINYMPKETGLPTVNLDSNTKATTQGAAGSKYIQWNKGKWSYVVKGNTQLKQDPTGRAKSVLALVNEYGVPNTSSHGSVNVVMGDSVGSLNTTIAWQDGNSVYKLEAHDTETALKMLNSLK
ncbi:hypothetical protein [Lactobacillus sp. LL6]|uniref:hypothetical protein n=1 Tax=Lactobacillus sp. LL6 TaxID=2596827 RepID=UPI001185B0EE|nr:hypothetical protein [Lactobacillus sp. LL6]TSO25338.1 hypothetical protein FOD82_08870 [Lactobacillus sp. LL6]